MDTRSGHLKTKVTSKNIRGQPFYMSLCGAIKERCDAILQSPQLINIQNPTCPIHETTLQNNYYNVAKSSNKLDNNIRNGAAGKIKRDTISEPEWHFFL